MISPRQQQQQQQNNYRTKEILHKSTEGHRPKAVK